MFRAPLSVLSFSLALFLSACGGGGGDDGPPTSEAPASGATPPPAPQPTSTPTSGSSVTPAPDSTSTSTPAPATDPTAVPPTTLSPPTDFAATVTTAPADGATISGTVRIEISGSGIENAELLPPTGYTPVYGTFSISPDKTTALLDLDTRTLPDGPLMVRASAFDAPAGQASAGEIIAMNSRSWQVQNAAPASGTSPAPAPSVIESQIIGEFSGWDGDTIVELTNGQIWKQAEYVYEYMYQYRPSVIIYLSGGRYVMQVDRMRQAVAVERLR
jgi:hypothetical protein